MYITIAGNIGSGKTTLTQLLSRHYGWEQLVEPVDDNPYLEDYYKDLPRWALPLEVFFLRQRFRNLLTIQGSPKTYVQDRCIYEGVYVFAANNHNMGNMDDRDFDTYMGLFDAMMTAVHQPDLMIYLRSSVPHLVANIQRRGRKYEQQIAIDYLKGLNTLYEDFIFRRYTGRTLVIDVDNLDFLHSKSDFGHIVSLIDSELFGLFPPERNEAPTAAKNSQLLTPNS